MDFTYEGRVSLPKLAGGLQFSFEFSPGTIAYDSDTNRVFLQGHGNYFDIAEFELPDVGQTVSKVIWRDWTQGNLTRLAAIVSTIKHRGICYADGGLYGNVQPYYNVSNTWGVTHWFSNGQDFSGFGKLSLRPLQWGGYLGILPPSIKEKTGYDSWMFDNVSQGIADTNQGPALALFNRQSPIPQEVTLYPLFNSYRTNAYPDWDGSRQINGMAFTDTHAVYMYRKSFGARWYGDGSFGKLINEPGGVESRHQIQSQLYPGRLAIDPYQPGGIGNKAEEYRLHFLCCTIESLLTGKPIWEEIDVSKYMTRSLRGQATVAPDYKNGRLIVCELSAVGSIPCLHIFKVVDMERIKELEAEVTRLKSLVDSGAVTIEQLRAEVTRLNSLSQQAIQILQGQ